MGSKNVLNDIMETIEKNLPRTIEITDVEFEGPEVVVYTKNPGKLADNDRLIRELARKVRKRIAVRPDPRVLMEPGKAKQKIKEVTPANANLTNIEFNAETGEVIIEARKPGLVIGRYGKTLSEITKEIGWSPKVVRTPPIPSNIIKAVRQTLSQERDARKQFLQQVGSRIHQTVEAAEEWIRISLLGGCREVGRTAILLQTATSQILIDCGINVASENDAFPYLTMPEFKLENLDGVIVTHAHLDHSGFVPYLYKFGYDGPVYCTPATRDLMTLLQIDYLDVAQREGKKVPYSRKHTKEVVKHTIPLEYEEVTDIAPDIRLTLHNAGHILGSSLAHFHIGEGLHNIICTGDFKFEQTRLFDSATYKFPRLETLLIESTYGGLEDLQPSRPEAEKELVHVLNTTINNGGKAIIPVFAVGRAQEIMVVLEEYMQAGKLVKAPIFLDGMIWDATAIHTAYPEYLCKDLREKIFHGGANPFLSDIFERVGSTDERKDVIGGEPAIILSTSGMLTGGPVIEYLKQLAPDKENTLVFVGYQAEGSLGRRIQKGWREIPMSREAGKTEVIKVNMDVKTIEGFSGHSDRNQLINYVRKLTPKPERILTCHGDDAKCVDLASALYKLFKIETRAPLNLETVRVE